MIACVDTPAFASSFRPAAASAPEYCVAPPSSMAFDRNASSSAPVAPVLALTAAMFLSNSMNDRAAAPTPRPIASMAGVIASNPDAAARLDFAARSACVASPDRAAPPRVPAATRPVDMRFASPARPRIPADARPVPEATAVLNRAIAVPADAARVSTRPMSAAISDRPAARPAPMRPADICAFVRDASSLRASPAARTSVGVRSSRASRRMVTCLSMVATSHPRPLVQLLGSTYCRTDQRSADGCFTVSSTHASADASRAVHGRHRYGASSTSHRTSGSNATHCGIPHPPHSDASNVVRATAS